MHVCIYRIGIERFFRSYGIYIKPEERNGKLQSHYNTYESLSCLIAVIDTVHQRYDDEYKKTYCLSCFNVREEKQSHDHQNKVTSSQLVGIKAYIPPIQHYENEVYTQIKEMGFYENQYVSSRELTYLGKFVYQRKRPLEAVKLGDVIQNNKKHCCHDCSFKTIWPYQDVENFFPIIFQWFGCKIVESYISGCSSHCNIYILRIACYKHIIDRIYSAYLISENDV